jgi:hypothetical protein
MTENDELILNSKQTENFHSPMQRKITQKSSHECHDKLRSENYYLNNLLRYHCKILRSCLQCYSAVMYRK